MSFLSSILASIGIVIAWVLSGWPYCWDIMSEASLLFLEDRISADCPPDLSVFLPLFCE